MRLFCVSLLKQSAISYVQQRKHFWRACSTRWRTKKLLNRQGQGMSEYIIIVALVAVAAIGVYQLFGQVVRSQTAAMAKELAGEDGSSDSQTAQSAAANATAQTAAKSLKSFTGNASAGE